MCVDLYFLWVNSCTIALSDDDGDGDVYTTTAAAAESMPAIPHNPVMASGVLNPFYMHSSPGLTFYFLRANLFAVTFCGFGVVRMWRL